MREQLRLSDGEIESILRNWARQNRRLGEDKDISVSLNAEEILIGPQEHSSGHRITATVEWDNPSMVAAKTTEETLTVLVQCDTCGMKWRLTVASYLRQEGSPSGLRCTAPKYPGRFDIPNHHCGGRGRKIDP